MKQSLILSLTPFLQNAPGFLPDLAVPDILPLGQGLDVGQGIAKVAALDDPEVPEERLVPAAVGGRQPEELGESDVFGPLVPHEEDQRFGLDELVLLSQDGEEEGLVEFLEV